MNRLISPMNEYLHHPVLSKVVILVRLFSFHGAAASCPCMFSPLQTLTGWLEGD